MGTGGFECKGHQPYSVVNACLFKRGGRIQNRKSIDLTGDKVIAFNPFSSLNSVKEANFKRALRYSYIKPKTNNKPYEPSMPEGHRQPSMPEGHRQLLICRVANPKSGGQSFNSGAIPDPLASSGLGSA